MARDVSTATLRRALAANRFLQWASAVIVMGIVSYFISKYSQGTHLIYEEVIACIATALYLVALVLPFIKSYRGYMWPIDLIFSYLWLTAFVFEAEDYNRRSCSRNAPPEHHGCRLKYALEAFTFLAFFFTLTAAYLDWRLWDAHRPVTGGAPGYEKHDPSRPSADTSTTAP